MKVHLIKVRLLSLVLVLLLGGVLAGCSAGASNSSSASSGSGKAAAPALERASAASGGVPQPDDKPLTSGNVATAETLTRLIRTAQVTLEVPNLATAADSVRAIAVTLGGLVSAETTDFPAGTTTSNAVPPGGPDPVPAGGHGQSVITLRVPEPQLDNALNRLAPIGRELERSSSSTDVTGTIADLDSRVSSQTRSVDRVRALMSQAKSLKDVVLIESELSQRESDLEALQAKQRVLDDQADLATLTVTLRTPATVAAVRAAKTKTGFLPGLRGGWHALVASTAVVLTGLGAVLPIGIVLLVIAVPGYLIYRQLRRRTSAGPAGPAPSAPTS